MVERLCWRFGPKITKINFSHLEEILNLDHPDQNLIWQWNTLQRSDFEKHSSKIRVMRWKVRSRFHRNVNSEQKIISFDKYLLEICESVSVTSQRRDFSILLWYLFQTYLSFPITYLPNNFLFYHTRSLVLVWVYIKIPTIKIPAIIIPKLPN